jgi:hypothetical protein
VYELFYAGEVMHATAHNFDAIWIEGPLTPEFEPLPATRRSRITRRFKGCGPSLRR